HTRFSRDWSSDVCSSDLIFLLLSLLACSPAEPPEAVAARFWEATLSGDEAGAWDAVLPGGFDRANFHAARQHELFETVTLGESRREDDLVRIDTRLGGIIFGKQRELQFETVLLLRDREWKVDYAATTSGLIGALLQETVDSADQSLRNNLLQPDSRMQEAIQDDLRRSYPVPD